MSSHGPPDIDDSDRLRWANENVQKLTSEVDKLRNGIAEAVSDLEFYRFRNRDVRAASVRETLRKLLEAT